MQDALQHDNIDFFCARHVKLFRVKTPWSLAMKKLITSLPLLSSVSFDVFN